MSSFAVKTVFTVQRDPITGLHVVFAETGDATRRYREFADARAARQCAAQANEMFSSCVKAVALGVQPETEARFFREIVR